MVQERPRTWGSCSGGYDYGGGWGSLFSKPALISSLRERFSWRSETLSWVAVFRRMGLVKNRLKSPRCTVISSVSSA